MAQRTRQTKKNNSLVPIIFTIGVIGWGFFVIDRLTYPLKQSNQAEFFNEANEAKVSNKKKDIKNSTWKNQLGKWLEAISGEANNISESLPIKTDPIEETKATLNSTEIKLYYYFSPNENASPIIKVVKRSIAAETQIELIENTLREFLKGPTSQEIKRGFYKLSFDERIAIKSLSLNRKTLVINFNDYLKSDSGFQIVKYQLKQLVKTCTQFNFIDSISLKINNSPIESLSSDGLTVPPLIAENSDLFL